MPLDELHVDALISRLYDPLKLTENYSLDYPHAISRFKRDLEIYYNENLTLEQVPEQIRESVSLFTHALDENRLLTFNSMIRHAIENLQEYGPLKNLKSLYVDEYQDVNPAQVDLIKSMIPSEAKLVAIGDDLQSIYQWRGSDVKRIINFSDDFHEPSTFRNFYFHRMGMGEGVKFG